VQYAYWQQLVRQADGITEHGQHAEPIRLYVVSAQVDGTLAQVGSLLPGKQCMYWQQLVKKSVGAKEHSHWSP